ncbi:unnamed protein product [Rotaria sp. Silwood2]|nr:unnamed protein product [Rotaria sp. Silwood2]CAF2720645.1 unnamed protein product [Rotaria sp. Silwood2]CAF2969183.1 unnamed protein product [Rotaria sp. Silwood2]CAF3142702.1 unnamed protein product [Rotaria sp. Silwood2]CAF3879089.1 unnamed protein product [Rotaria sp. Silwood2]
MNNTSQFDVGKAALQHLELLNCSNQNPLEIAAQFRTLLRSKKSNKNINSSNIDYTYTDYIAADATIRRRRRSQSLVDYHRSKSLGKIQYDLNEDQSLLESNSSSGLMKYQNVDNIREDIFSDSAMGSDSSDITNHKIDLNILSNSNDLNNEINCHKISKENNNSNRFQYPIINWKQLREKQYENKLDKVKKFLSTKFKTIRLSRIETKDLNINLLTNDLDKTDSCPYSNISELEKNSEEIISTENISSSSSPRTRSLSSNSIRTPSISPSNSPRSTYTVSRLNSTLINHNHNDIFFPIADCNLIIKHQPIEQSKRVSHVKNLRTENELFLW